MVDDSMLVRRLPNVYVGFALAAALLAIQLYVTLFFKIPGMGVLLLLAGVNLIIDLGAWFYWLYCVYKFHDVMSSIQGYNHPISSSRAVAMHWIPVYNFYWVFKWPSEISSFVNWRMQSPHAMNKHLAGVLVVAGFLLRVTPFPLLHVLSLVLLFSAGVYVSRQIHDACVAPPVPKSQHASAAQGPLGL